jgi:hypothetical protein
MRMVIYSQSAGRDRDGGAKKMEIEDARSGKRGNR